MSDNWDAAGKPEAPKGKSIHEFFAEQLRKKFMTPQADLIREAHAAGFKWSGEDTHHKLEHLDGLSHFEHVYREWKLMKEVGLVEYKKESLARLDAYSKRCKSSDGRRSS